MRPGPALLALAGLAHTAPARGQGPRYEVRAEVGVEYDSNPGRREEVPDDPDPTPIQGSPVGRLVIDGDLAVPAGARHAFSLSVGLAGKAFSEEKARGEDLLVAQASAGWTILLGRRTGLGLSGTYYDVGQRPGAAARDFRSLAPGLRLEQALGAAGQLTVGAGYRRFTYKPEHDLDFAGPSAFLSYRHLSLAEQPGMADWEWSVGVSAEARLFAGGRCIGLDVCLPDAPLHRDTFWMGHLEVTRTGTFLAGGGLGVDGNLSNSYGAGVLRGLAHIRAVFFLPAAVVLSLRAELVAARYSDAVPVARAGVTGTPLATIEDERRSTVRVEALRPLSARVDLGARYTLYTNEIGASPVRFRRQIVLVFLALTGGS
jgi:hypothetical protein